MFRAVLALSLIASTFALACAPAADDEASGETSEAELRRRVDAAWFYDGPLPAFEDAEVTVSLKGHTARVRGYVPAETNVDLPHAKAVYEGDRLRVDVVYPIATARPGKSNSRPGLYDFQMAKPYRPDGLAYTVQEGEHYVPWGGYPFVAYNGGIAFHGPITAQDPSYTSDVAQDDIWYLQRGPVSGGCNRMMAEHIVEFTHVIGVSMRKVYSANKAYAPNTSTAVNVIAGYDMVDDKYVDVDYPTWTGAVRPASVHGAENVEMFGSWVATETPDGSDHPASMKWEGGVRGKYYVFGEHARTGMLCSVEKVDMAKLKTFAATFPGSELPKGFCAKKDCVISALRSGKNARTTCRL
jgi:hypothetical protein